MIQTRKQILLGKIYDALYGSDGDEYRELVGSKLLVRLPGMIQRHGLLQMLLYLKRKHAKATGKNEYGQACELIVGHLEDPDSRSIQYIAGMNYSDYLRLNLEAIEIANVAAQLVQAKEALEKKASGEGEGA